jgi:hypothetical protein
VRRIAIRVNTPGFQAELIRSGNGRVPNTSRADLARLPLNVHILIGDKTAAYGGGLSGIGYVMQNGRATHSLSITPNEVRSGALMST